MTKLTEVIGNISQKINKKTLSIILGLLIAFYAKFNIFDLIGLPCGWKISNNILLFIITMLGILFSGLILSTGSNGIHDLLSRLQNSKEIKQVELKKLKKDEIK